MALRSSCKWLGLMMLLLCTATASATDLDEMSGQHAFFNRLLTLCDASFSGQSSFPNDKNDPFAGKELRATLKHCTPEEIRIPFAVGEERSRTWLLRWQQGRLELKHDHRHEDGTPDEVTMYGGLASDSGSALQQSFPADAHTAKLIPAAATNVWALSLNEQGTELTYYLERDGKPRFKATLIRQ